MKRTSRIAAFLLAGALSLPAGNALAIDGRIVPVPVTPLTEAQPMQLAQAGDATYRVNQLEEQLRLLNGRVEELTFQLLQMQEQLRKMQEDNEFRFQQIEERRGALSQGDRPVAEVAPGQGDLPGKSQPSEQDTGAQRSDGDLIARAIETGNSPKRMIDGVEVYDGTQTPVADGLQPRTLGQLTFDADGNVIGAEPGDPVDLSRPGEGVSRPAAGADGNLPPVIAAPGVPPAGEQRMAALPAEMGPDELYAAGNDFVQAGDYASAEEAFRSFSERFADNPRAGEAGFWLGESILSQRRYEEAAKVFLDTHKRFPQNRMAPQNLLKLGVSLAGMNQRELACATFAEVPRKYPDMPNAVRATVAAEQKAASCKNR